jgi:hypothetical protein
MGEISLPAIEQKSFTEKKRAPSVMIKPNKDIVPKTNIFQIKNFNYEEIKKEREKLE